MSVGSPQKKFFDVVRKKPERLNISPSLYIRLPLKSFLKVGFLLFAVIAFIGSVQAPRPDITLAAEETGGETTAEERAQLEQELKELENQIVEYQNTVAEYRKQGNTLKNEISALNAKISQLNLKIKAINLNLEQLSIEITETQKQINQTENNIVIHKDALSQAIRTIYEADGQTTIEILLTNENLSDFFGNIQNVTLVQSNLRMALDEIIRLREMLLEQKTELALEKDDVENLKAYQESQKRNVATTQSEKNELLTVTKGRESEYQKLVEEKQATAAEIRKRIFRLLGGGELTFEEAYQYAKLAEAATGVRAALTLAILDRESLFGKNVGRCSYTTAMHPTRDVPYFLDLLDRLGLDPNSEFVKVSCPIAAHGSYGGAMGPAQFIPSTWKLYESKIAAVTGNNPPNPWNNADAFAATAVYMKDLLGSSSCKSYADANRNVVSYQTLLERCAAAKYYSGSRWYTYRFWYGDPVVIKANEFEEDIRILTS
ncbi:MAG: lytic murein transglycosylase [Candidatus Jorgensenbacteria bacterium]